MSRRVPWTTNDLNGSGRRNHEQHKWATVCTGSHWLTIDGRLLKKDAADSLDFPALPYSVYQSESLIRRVSIDGAFQTVEAGSVWARTLPLFHYHVHFGHPGQKCMYVTLYWDYFLTPHSQGRLQTIQILCRMLQNAKNNWHLHHLNLFPGSGQLKVIAMNILSPLRNKSGRN